MPRVLFTRETAREMAARSNAVQRERRRDPVGLVNREADSDFNRAQRLVRVRRQQAWIDRRLEQALKSKTLDAQLIDRLAAASMRLSDQEFALAGRAKPANAKVEPARRRPTARPEPTPIEPTTTPSVPSAQAGQSQA